MKIRQTLSYLSSILRFPVVAGIFCLGLAQAQIAPPAFTLNSFGQLLTSDLYIGIEIQVTTPQLVSALGVLDATSLGTLPTNVGVGLYSVSPGGTSSKLATHITSAIVPSGTVAQSIGARGAFFTAITPVTLAAGNYVIMADSGAPGLGYGSATYTFQPGISYVNGWFGGTNFPGLGTSFTVTDQSDFGGNWVSSVFRSVPAPTTSTSLSSSVNPYQGGSNALLTVTATVTPLNATGTVNFSSNGATITASLFNGLARLVQPNFLLPGPNIVSAVYSGDSNFAGSAAINLVQQLNQATTTLTLSASPTNAVLGQNVRLTAVLGLNFDTGTITFKDGNTTLGASTLAGNTATFTATGLAAGPHFLTAAWGDSTFLGTYAPVTSLPIGVIVSPFTSTTTTLTSSPNPSIAGQQLTLRATVTPAAATGQVTFTSGASILGTATLSGGVATLNTSLGFGQQTLTAIYVPTGNFTASTSPPLNQQIVYPALSISTSGIPAGRAGQPYGPATFSAQGGSGSYSWAAGGLPSGMGISGNGTLSGTPGSAASTSITVTVTDTASSLTASQNYTLVIASGVPLISGPSSLGNVLVGTAVAASYTVSGGKAPFSWTITGAPGISIDANGNVSGSAASAGSFTATIVVTDAQNSTAGISATLTVLGIATGSLPPAQTIADYSVAISAVGGAPPYSFTISGLPAGLSASGGNISGRPLAPGTSSVSVKVADSKGLTLSATYSLTVTGSGPLKISGTSAPDGSVNQPYSQGLSASGGTPPYSWVQTGGIFPDGLSLNAAGTVSGTPSRPGSSSFGVQVTDASAAQVSGAFSLNVLPEPLTITNGANLPSGVAGVEYPSQTLIATGGTPPYKFSTKDTLPSGVVLTGGVISGTPATEGSASFSIAVTDSATSPATATAGFSLAVRPNTGDLVLSTGSLSFALTAGTSAAPDGGTVAVSSSQATQKLSFSASVTPSAAWLTVTGGAATPGTLSVALTSGALSLAATGSPYSTSVVVTCTSPVCAGKTQSVAVVLSVTSAPPRLSVGTSLLSFAASAANPQPISAALDIQNTGGGSLTAISASADARWITVGAVPASIAPGPAVQISVTANPAGLKPGYYRATISISSSAGKASVPATLLISADSTMTLGPAGTQLSLPAGGVVGKSSGSFLVSVNSNTAVGYNASVLPGASWLVVPGGAGSAGSASPGVVGFAINPVEAAALKAGAYYGTVRVTAQGIVNAPQDFQVILNVTPAASTVQPDPQPAGLLFLTVAGAGTPPPQIITLYASSRTPLTYQASATSDGGWLSINSTGGSTLANTPAQIGVSADPTSLKPGIYRGTVSVSYSGTAVRNVNVTLLIQASLGGTLSFAAPLDRPSPRASAASCTGAQLVPTQTGLVGNFAAPTAWPTPLAIRLVDTCGNVIPNGQVVATFSNGDPPLAITLVDGKTGLYSATWTPRKPAQQVTINARATALGYATTTAQIAGQVTPNEVPSIDPNGAQDIFRPQTGGGLGPGNIIQIYGRNLASQINSPAALPLPTAVLGTSVLIGGVASPLFYVSPGQINAQVPFELVAGKQYQVIVNANGALTTPQLIQLNAGTPATLQFTSGLIVAQHQDGSLILDTSPAKPGEAIVFYMTGLGATDIDVPSGQASPSDPPARVKDVPVVTLNGNPVTVLFAGLTPSLVGLYQVNLQVPASLADGTYKVEVSQSGTSGNSTTLTIRN